MGGMPASRFAEAGISGRAIGSWFGRERAQGSQRGKAATEDGFAAKERKRTQKKKRFKHFPLYSLRSFAAKNLPETV
jgi:hypothetical protein